jgi:hypothetical protein
MKQLLSFLLVFMSFTASFSQTFEEKNKVSHGASVDIGMSYIPYQLGYTKGVDATIKYFFNKKWAAGITILSSAGTISDNFSLTIGKPNLNYYEYGCVIQYALWNSRKFQINTGMVNGISKIEITDDAQLRTLHNRFGYYSEPKTVATNQYYLVQPRLEMAYKMATEHTLSLWLTAKANYNFLFGNSTFGDISEFPNHSFSIGLMIKSGA